MVDATLDYLELSSSELEDVLWIYRALEHAGKRYGSHTNAFKIHELEGVMGVSLFMEQLLRKQRVENGLQAKPLQSDRPFYLHRQSQRM